MIDVRFIDCFSEIANLGKEFSAVASYLKSTENPNINELDSFVRNEINDHTFNLWRFVRPFDGKEYDKLIGFFKYFNIEMEQFIHSSIGQFLFEYLKDNQNNIRIFNNNSTKHYDTVKFTCNFSNIYFYHENGLYTCYELSLFWNRCVLMNVVLPKITKIELKKDKEWVSVIVIQNGEILNSERFYQGSN